MKAYLKYVRDESQGFFDRGLTASDAAGKIDLGPYADWISPERIYLNVERAYREFRGEPSDQLAIRLHSFMKQAGNRSDSILKLLPEYTC